MGLSVTEKALKKTTKCTKQFGCMAGHVANICSVAASKNPGQLYCLHNETGAFCAYRQKIEKDKTECTCPVRNELYDRYGI